jgi:phenylalanyl-tRNA synthetase beta chain
MKVSYQWLKDYCDFDLSPHELAEELSQRGLAMESLEQIGDDFCLDLEVTANRPDLLCHIGVAREIAAFTGVPLRIPEIELQEAARSVTEIARVEVQHPDLCPRYTARVLLDLQVGPTPPEMQRRLEVVGLRPVNNIVDITNYVLMECGQPQHAFDFEKLRRGVVVIRPAKGGELIELIDGSKVELAPEHLVIADAERPIALAGIMGGLQTEISDATHTVLLESAKFDPVNIRRSTRSTGKSSDSSYRFERTVDTPTVEWASRRAAALMHQHAGAKVAAGVIDVNFTREETRTVTLRIPRIERVLGRGMDIGAAEVGRLLKGIGFGVKARDHDSLSVSVPSFRPDVNLEIDLIEEVARCHGYDEVPTTSSLLITDVAESKFDRVVGAARRTLIRLGYHEAVTTSFLSEEVAKAFSPWGSEAPVCVSNPLRADEAALRQSLIPSLLEAKRTNQDRGVGEVRLFEVGRVYLRRSEGHRLPGEKTCLAVVADEDPRCLRGAAEAVLERLGLGERAAFEPATCDLLTPGLSAAWRLGPTVLGWLGEIADEAAAAFHLRRNPCAVEFDLDAIAVSATLEPRYRDLPRFPSVVRDLAIVVDEAVAWDQVATVAGNAGAEHVESIRFGEIYHGEQIEAGKKGVFFTVTYRAPDRTLTNDEVNASQELVIAALGDKLGATLRA